MICFAIDRDLLTFLLQILDYTVLRLPDSLQRQALDELKMYATSRSPFDDLDQLRRRAALYLAECYLIGLGTDYDSAEALHWLKVAKSYSIALPLGLCRISETLGFPAEHSKKHQLKAVPEGSEIEDRTSSELYLMRRIQSRFVSANKQIRASTLEGKSRSNVNHVEMMATGFIFHKIGPDVVGFADMTILVITALLGEDELMAPLLPTAEASQAHEGRINALHAA
ncbi:MAG: hypothetical protein Q9191_005075, partial [Dirinaria sp. TL-2023a]